MVAKKSGFYGGAFGVSGYTSKHKKWDFVYISLSKIDQKGEKNNE